MKLNVQPRFLSVLPLTAGLVLALTMPQGWALGSLQETPPKKAEGVVLVKNTFQKLDANKDGSVTAAESQAGRIPSALFQRHDVDNNKSLSADEFVVLYKQLLVQNKRAVPQDLASEVARIQARRRVLEEEAKKAQQKQSEGKPETAPEGKPVAQSGAGPANGPVAKPVTQSDPQPVVSAPAAGEQEADVQKAADAQVVKSVQGAQPIPVTPQDVATDEETAKRIEEARRKQADLTEARIREARVKTAAEQAEARTLAGRIKAAEQAEARTKAARVKLAEQMANGRIQAAREKAAAEAASDGTQKPAEGKPQRIPGGEVKSAKRSVQSVTRRNETKPAEATPVQAKPAEIKPAETKPDGATPVESKPAEIKPVASKPATGSPAAEPSTPPAARPVQKPAATPIKKPAASKSAEDVTPPKRGQSR